jgi:serine/threonine protein kinase
MGSYQRRQEILTQALATPPAERGAFLDTACGADAELRRDVERLLSDQAEESPTRQSSAKASSPTLTKTSRVRSRLKQALRHNYIIQERIGGGGMGDLYLATHKTLGGKWAIKVLAEDLAKDPRVVERFKNEAKIEANLQHPNIVKVFNIGQSGGYHYFVMSYVEGEDLAERIGRCGPLPQPEAVSISLQICRALECAHDHNIFHRDLKPSNVRIDRYGTVFVLDFGIARARDVAMSTTSEGERLGTPLYMSPEQIKGASVDARSDLYSLGVLMYEMLTGVNPFQANTAHAVYAKHLYQPLQHPADINPRISPVLSEILLRLLEKDPEKRFQSAHELSSRLRPLRETTEVTPSGKMRAVAAPDMQIADDRLNHVVVRVQATVISRDLSPEEKKLLELTDGKRTIAEMLAQSQLDKDRFFIALESLKGDAAIQTLAEPPKETPVSTPQRRIQQVLEYIPGNLRWLLAAVPLAILLIGAGSWYLLHRQPSAASEVTSVQIDASPYSDVTIKDSQGRVVRKDTTPLLISLPPGHYSVEFYYEGAGLPRPLARPLQVEKGKPVLIRENFWKDDEDKKIESVLNDYLEKD